MAELNPSAPAFYPSSFFSLYHSFSTTFYYPPPLPDVYIYFPLETYYSQVLSPSPPPPPLLLSPPSLPQASPFTGNISKPSKRPFTARLRFSKGYVKARAQTDFKKWSSGIKSEWRPKEEEKEEEEEEEEEEEDFLPDNLESSDDVQSKSLVGEGIKRLGKKTTVMIRNIPNRYTKDMLVKLLDKHCTQENSSTKNKKKASAYDFVYLPIDFGSKCNKGYAFVNFTEPVAVWRLNKLLQNHKWGILNSKKICEVNYARLQGIEALKEQFEKTTFVCETDDYLPTYFSPPRDGSAESVQQFLIGKRVNPLNAQ